MDEKYLIEVFRWLHRHPELALQEHGTTEYLKKALQENGVRLLDTGLETGLIAVIGSGSSPVIALRADIDALPIEEETTLPYTSETPGVMHACGHDFHAALILRAYQKNGCIRFRLTWGQGACAAVFSLRRSFSPAHERKKAGNHKSWRYHPEPWFRRTRG